MQSKYFLRNDREVLEDINTYIEAYQERATCK